MRFFFDTEFIEDGTTIDLISIGIKAEDGRTYYAESIECRKLRASAWVKENVFPHLTNDVSDRKMRSQIAKEVLWFCGSKPEFWGYYADYDWVVLCQLYGRMIDLPKGWPMFCLDVKQYAMTLGNPQLPPQLSTKHHALSDAIWTADAWHYLEKKRVEGSARSSN